MMKIFTSKLWTLTASAALCVASSAALSAQVTLDALTPSGDFFPTNKAGPYLEFSYFQTFAQAPTHDGEAVAPVDEFPQSSTTLVFSEIELKNLLYGIEDRQYTLNFKYYLENGRLVDDYKTQATILSTWDYAWYYASWGWNQPGQWPLGTHRVELWIDGTRFAIKRFKIVEG